MSQYPPQQPWGSSPDQSGQWGQQPPPQWPGPPQSQSLPPQGPWQQQPPNYQQSGPQWQQQPGQYAQQPMYPPGGYPPPQPPKKKSKRGAWIIVGILAVVMVFSCVSIAAILANTGKAAQSSVDTTLTSIATDVPTLAATIAPTIAPTNQHFKMGQVVNVGSIDDVTVNTAKLDKGGAYNTLQKAGDVYLVFNVTIKNLSQQEQSISSLAQFNLTDTTGQKYDAGFDTNAGASLDGKVEPGSLLRGSVVYEVPSSVKNFVLSFQTDLFTSGQTEWDI